MTVKNIVDQVESLYGRQSHTYIMQLINDALLDIASEKQHYTVEEKMPLVSGKRWYDLPDNCVDILKVEILDTSTDARYHLIPKLVDYHRLLKYDSDDGGTGDVS